MATALLLIFLGWGVPAAAQDIITNGGTTGGTTVTGGSCAALNFVTAISINGVPTCSTVGAGDFVSNTATTVVNEIVLFADTGGKLGKRSTGSGLAKLTSGVLSAITAPAGTVVGTSDTQDLTNKTYEAMTFTGGAFTVAFGATGGTVTYTTNTQTLTNKTLTTPTIGSFTNATHTHANAAGGGTLDGTIFGNVAANCFWGGPNGSSGTSTCRVMTSDDLPQVQTYTALTSAPQTIAAYGALYTVNIGGAGTFTLPTTTGHDGATMAFTGLTGTSDWTLDGAGAETICDATTGSVCTATKTYAAGVTVNLQVYGASWYVVSSERPSGTAGTIYPKAPGLRLTTESAVCQSTSDRSSQGAIYYTPAGNCGGSSYLALYSGTAWVEFKQAEINLSLTVTSGKNYDVFACYNAGTPNLALSAAWTNDTTRADALALQDGFSVKSSDHTCLAIGLIRASGANATEDSKGDATTQVGGKRFVWNRWNQLPTDVGIKDTTDSWTYTTDTWRQANAAAGNKVEFITGESATALVSCMLIQGMYMDFGSTPTAKSAVGIDSTTVASGHYAQFLNAVSSAYIGTSTAQYSGRPGLGYHYIAWIEKGSPTGVYLGDDGGTIQSGMTCQLQN